MREFQAVVMGGSSGSFVALQKILSALPKAFPLPIIVVQHLSPDSGSLATSGFYKSLQIPFKEAEDKEPICPGIVYFGPPNYHLLVEADRTMSLSVDEKENYSRPSVDVLFETAAVAYGPDLVGVILTGANSDGAIGLERIHKEGGFTIVQDPKSAEASEMPASAIKRVAPDLIFSLEEMAPFIRELKFKNEETVCEP